MIKTSVAERSLITFSSKLKRLSWVNIRKNLKSLKAERTGGCVRACRLYYEEKQNCKKSYHNQKILNRNFQLFFCDQ